MHTFNSSDAYLCIRYLKKHRQRMWVQCWSVLSVCLNTNRTSRKYNFWWMSLSVGLGLRVIPFRQGRLKDMVPFLKALDSRNILTPWEKNLTTGLSRRIRKSSDLVMSMDPSHGLTHCSLLTPYGVNIGSGNGLLPDGTKPLPEPMLT